MTGIDQFVDIDEPIRWRGKPKGGVLLRPQDIFLVPFSLVWGGFVIFFFLFLANSPHGFSFLDPSLMIPILFLVIAQYITWGRFVIDAAVRAKTDYVITPTRAIIVHSLIGRTFRSMPITPELQIDVTGRSRGTIKFGPGGFQWFNLNPFYMWQGPIHPFAFEQIRNVTEVYQLIRSIQTGKG